MSLPWRRSLLCFCALAVMGLLPLVSQAQELRYKFQAGTKNSYSIEQKQTMKMPQGEMKNNMTMEFTMTVDSVDTATGKAKVSYKFDRVKMEMSMGPMGGFEFDTKSDKEPEGPLAMAAPIFKAMTSAPITMTVSPRGEISDVKLPDKLKEEFQAVAGGMNLFSEDQLKQMMNNGLFELPKDAPTKDTTWEKKTDMKLGPIGTMKMTTKYTYDGKSGSYDKIKVKIDSTLESDPNAPFQMKMTTKDASGTILFDNTKGRLQEMTNNTVSEMEMGQMGTMQMTQNMTMKLKQ